MFRWSRSTAAKALVLLALAGVCAAQTPNLSAAAKVISLSGQVSVMRDSVPWALQVGDQVQPKQLILTGPDGIATFQVSDGSTFDVYPNSRVTFRDNPGDWSDLLEMFLGRIKVRIQKLNGQPNRNRVRTPTAVISVRGTVFDVAIEDEDDTTYVAVEEGQVAVQHKLLPRGEPRLLNPGEWIRVWKREPLAQGRIDRGTVVKTALRSVADALYTIVYRGPRGSVPVGGTGTGGGGVGLPGDTGPTNPPPPPPPSDPPPPPPQ